MTTSELMTDARQVQPPDCTTRMHNDVLSDARFARLA